MIFNILEYGAAGDGKDVYKRQDIAMDHENYTVSQMHSNYVKDLDYVSVVPTRNILRSSSWFATVFCILVGGAIVLAMILAVFKTQKDYKLSLIHI